MEIPGGEPGPRASRREWLGLAVLVVPSMLAMVDLEVLFLALPRLTADLGATATEQLWISDIYGFMIAGFLVTMGTLGDRVGRRRVLLTGAAAFGLLSLLASFSTTPEMLILSRALMGVAGATIFPSTLSMINGMFRNPKQLGIAVAVWATGLTAGVALGPVIGGVLLNWFWWGSVFLINVPVMLLMLLAGPALLPDLKDPNARRLDPLSVLLSLTAILAFIYGLKEVARNGWRPLAVAMGLAGLVIGVIFVLRQRRLVNPLVDLRLFAIRAVSGSLLLGLLVAAVQGGIGFFIAMYLQLVLGLSPLSAGLWLLVPTIALVITIFISQGLAQQVVRPAHILGVGLVLAAVGMVILTQITASSGLGLLMAGVIVMFVGAAPVGPMVSQIVVPSAPPEKSGSASSLQSTSGELGIALGIALLGSVGTAAYRSELVVPAEIAGTPAGDAARETIAGAGAVAQSQPPELASALVDSAREAFVFGFNVASVIGAVGFAALAVLAIATLRHLKPFAAEPERTTAETVPPTTARTPVLD